MDNPKEWWLNFTQLDLVNGISGLEPWLPDLESKLKSIQRFLRKVTRGQSPEKIKEMLPLLGFSIVGDGIEYDFWDFSVKFPIEKCFTRSVLNKFSKSLISEELSDALSDNGFDGKK